jgi:Uma2 family endonuclease
MTEYLSSGTQLGWLIDPDERKVWIYRPGEPVECLENPAQVTGDPVLPGLILRLAEIWGD